MASKYCNIRDVLLGSAHTLQCYKAVKPGYMRSEKLSKITAVEVGSTIVYTSETVPTLVSVAAYKRQYSKLQMWFQHENIMEQ